MSDEADIRSRLKSWAAAAVFHDLAEIVKDRNDAIVMFDLPDCEQKEWMPKTVDGEEKWRARA